VVPYYGLLSDYVLRLFKLTYLLAVWGLQRPDHKPEPIDAVFLKHVTLLSMIDQELYTCHINPLS
jgi:hypothetical protein